MVMTSRRRFRASHFAEFPGGQKGRETRSRSSCISSPFEPVVVQTAPPCGTHRWLLAPRRRRAPRVDRRRGLPGRRGDRRDETLRLPAPADLLWRYVHSTPLAQAVAEVDPERRAALERDVVQRWQPFTERGTLRLELRRSSRRRASR